MGNKIVFICELSLDDRQKLDEISKLLDLSRSGVVRSLISSAHAELLKKSPRLAANPIKTYGFRKAGLQAGGRTS